MWAVCKDLDISWNFRQPLDIHIHICVYHFISFVYVCVHTHSAIQSWRRKPHLCLMTSEAAAQTYTEIICLKAHGLTHANISRHTYKQLQASAHAHSPIHIYHTHILLHSNFIVLLFLSLSHKTYYLFVPLYSHVIVKYLIIICNSVLLI